MLFLLIPCGLAIGYTLPLLAIKSKRIRLRDHFLLKLIVLSLTWCLVTVAIPLIEIKQDLLSRESLFIISERFFYMLAICIPFEIRDLEVDRNRGLQTLPAYTGITESKWIALASILFFQLLVTIHERKLSNEPHTVFFYPLSIITILTALLIFFSGKNRNDYYYRFGVDGTMYLQLFLLIFNST